jgi:RsiW-degrading membrane proteinase PrsW (M82 family)
VSVPEQQPPIVSCAHCGHAVPAGAYCGHCGAQLAGERPGDGRRRHAFAGMPGEHVRHLSLVTTLFPHLPSRGVHAFRWVLIIGSVLFLVLAGFHLFAPATAVAAALLPALYLLYLYEAEVYEHEPWLVVSATFAAGAILGVAFNLALAPAVTSAVLSGDRGAVLLAGVVMPVLAQCAMLAGPLLLLWRPHFDETLDGLTFGAASALGFSLTSTLIVLGPILIGPLVGSGSTLDWGLRLLRAGILFTVVNASTTALITAAVWLARHGRSRSLDESWRWGLPAAVGVAFGAQVVLGVAGQLLADLLLDVMLWAAAAVALLLYLRLVLHHALLEEGAEHEVGPGSTCPECGRTVPLMLFCPACGVARSAASKRRPKAAI